MAERTPAEVPLSFFEYRAFYREPLFEIWGQHGGLVHAVYQAFREWNVSLENVTGKENPANASEMQVNFNLLNWKVVFSVGIGSAALFVTNPDWSEAELIAKIARAGLEAVVRSSKVEIEKQLVTLSMHLRPKGKSVREITSKYVHTDVGKLIPDRIRGFGFSVYGEESSWVIDLSASHADALFVRITRSFAGSIPLEDIAVELDKDEGKLMDMLQLSFD